MCGSSNRSRGYEYMGKKPKYVYGLNGQDVQKGGTVLYGPQYAVGGNQYRTTLSVVNLEDTAGMVTLRLISPEGVQIGRRSWRLNRKVSRDHGPEFLARQIN
jgi:hypothetical protein